LPTAKQSASVKKKKLTRQKATKASAN